MKKRFGTFAAMAIVLMLFPAGEGGAAKKKVRGPADRPAYLACYRQILAQPAFAALDPAGLYRIADGELAAAVIAGCEEHVQAYRKQLLEVALGSQRRAMEGGGTQLPEGMLLGIVDVGVRLAVGSDLVEADPRVKPIADADRRRD